jgi:hypothetical protein
MFCIIPKFPALQGHGGWQEDVDQGPGPGVEDEWRKMVLPRPPFSRLNIHRIPSEALVEDQVC